MTKEQFFDWLSGYFDICEPDRIGVVETQTIKDHIDLVRGINKLYVNIDESDYPKSSGGRGRPTIETPPPPIINTKGILPPKLLAASPFSNATVC